VLLLVLLPLAGAVSVTVGAVVPYVNVTLGGEVSVLPRRVSDQRRRRPASDRSPDPFQVRSRPINLESIRGASELRLAADRGYAEPPSGPLDLSSGLGHQGSQFQRLP
jgi:hypothetical protein